MSAAGATVAGMRSSLLLLACLLACGQKTEFDSAAEFEREMKEDGWVKIAAFGDPAWPARIVDEHRSRGTISFRGPDGTPREYQGFGGYELRVLRLEGEGGSRAIMLYRSEKEDE